MIQMEEQQMVCNSLSQLKKILKSAPRLEITDHCRKECVGEIRRVTKANTQGFYSVVDGQPEHKTSKANGGKGSVLWWSKALFWSFQDGICALYDSDTKHEEEHLIMAFRILREEAA